MVNSNYAGRISFILKLFLLFFSASLIFCDCPSVIFAFLRLFVLLYSTFSLLVIMSKCVLLSLAILADQPCKEPSARPFLYFSASVLPATRMYPSSLMVLLVVTVLFTGEVVAYGKLVICTVSGVKI